MADDPNWPRASAWLARSEDAPRLAVLGAPARLGSITPGRCDLAPAAIRAALARYSTYDLDDGVDVDALPVRDLGDLDIAALRLEDCFGVVRDGVARAFREAPALVVLGGDNGITRGALHGIGVPLERCALLTLDAHLDVRDTANGLSNGNPVRALLNDGLPGRNIAQIGVQSFANSRVYAEFARDCGITIVTAEAVRSAGIERVVHEQLAHLNSRADAIYVDLDLDAMDRMFAPGTPGSRPGGLTPAQLRRASAVCGLHLKVRVMDLVELDPEKDIADTTALTAAACLLSFASGVARRYRV